MNKQGTPAQSCRGFFVFSDGLSVGGKTCVLRLTNRTGELHCDVLTLLKD